MEHELGTRACVRAGFRADGAVVTEPTTMPRPLTVSNIAAGVWVFRIHVEGKSTHCGNRALAIRPGGPGDAIGVNALEKGDQGRPGPPGARDAVGDDEAPRRASRRGSSRSCRGSSHADPGLPSPVYFPNRAEIAYVMWYPPQQAAEEIREEVEGHVARRVPDRPVAARARAALRVAPQLAADADAVGARARAGDGARTRGGVGLSPAGPRARRPRPPSAPPATGRSTRTRGSRASPTAPATSRSPTARTRACRSTRWSRRPGASPRASWNGAEPRRRRRDPDRLDHLLQALPPRGGAPRARRGGVRERGDRRGQGLPRAPRSGRARPGRDPQVRAGARAPRPALRVDERARPAPHRGGSAAADERPERGAASSGSSR